MKHTTSLKLARYGAKLFLGFATMLVYLFTFARFDYLPWIAGSSLVFIAFLVYPHVERFFEEAFEIVEP